MKEVQKYARSHKQGLWKSDNSQSSWKYGKIKRNGAITRSNNLKVLDQVVDMTKSGEGHHHKRCSYLKFIEGSSPMKEAEALGYETCSRY